MTNSDGTALDASLFTWDSVSQKLTTYTSDINLYSGSPFDLTVNVAYAGYSSAGSLDFQVTLDIDCSLTTFEALTISTMTYTLFEASETQILPDLMDTVSQLAGNQDGFSFCGARQYSISTTPASSYSNVLELDAVTKTLTLGLAGSTYGDENDYTIEITVALASDTLIKTTASFTASVLCPTNPSVVSFPASSSTTTIDLLVGASYTIATPSLSAVPTSCFTVSWQIFNSAGDDLAITMSSIFSFSGSDLTVTIDEADFASRSALFGTQTFTFVATYSNELNTPMTALPGQNFDINFTDSCRTATI